MKKILLIEPNNCHMEVLPGIVKYLSDLQFNVDIYIRNNLLSDNAFCIYPDSINLYGYNFFEIKLILSNNNISEYDFIFFSSMELSINNKVLNILSYIGFYPKSKYGVLGIYHTTSFIDNFNDYKLAIEDRLFCFSDFQIHNNNLKTLAPIYFFNYLNNINNINNTLISIGGAFNYNLILKSLKNINFINKTIPFKVQLYGARFKNNCLIFNILYIIKYLTSILIFYNKLLNKFLNIIIPKTADKLVNLYFSHTYIIKNGYVSFSTLFNAIKNASFLLVLLDPNLEDNKHYLSFTTSGIRQIILGFRKIPVIHKIFAEKYGFDHTNSIIFDETNLHLVLLSLVNYDHDEYISKTTSLNNLHNKIYNNSLSNLDQSIEKIIERFNCDNS